MERRRNEQWLRAFALRTKSRFLDASTHLYMRVCLSVGRSFRHSEIDKSDKSIKPANMTESDKSDKSFFRRCFVRTNNMRTKSNRRKLIIKHSFNAELDFFVATDSDLDRRLRLCQSICGLPRHTLFFYIRTRKKNFTPRCPWDLSIFREKCS